MADAARQLLAADLAVPVGVDSFKGRTKLRRKFLGLEEAVAILVEVLEKAVDVELRRLPRLASAFGSGRPLYPLLSYDKAGGQDRPKNNRTEKYAHGRLLSRRTLNIVPAATPETPRPGMRALVELV